MLIAASAGAAPAGEPAGTLQATAPAAVAGQCARGSRRLQRHAACALGKGVYLVAWCDGSTRADEPTADIYCARVAADTARMLDPAGIRVCAAADSQEWPAVAFDGTNFLIVWQDLRGGKDYDVYAARVSEAGKVLDPGGFAVVRRPGNQARPAVAFAAGGYVVAWMDARQYPVYGLYAARVRPDATVLDADGRALDTEDPPRIAKARPTGKSWLGDRHYWWGRLSSRFQPAAASDGKTCLVTYLREVHSNRTTGRVLRVRPRDGSVIGEPAALSGEPRTRIAACAVPGGWVVAFDQWLSGWTPTPRMAALRLDEALKARDVIPRRAGGRDAQPTPMLMDLQKLLAPGEGNYHQGKGHFAFWQAAAAWTGRHVVVAMDYGWRLRRKCNELRYAVAVSRFDVEAGRFVDSPPLVAASGSSASGVSVCRPALAAGPGGRTLLVYEVDRGIDRRTVEARLLRAGPPGGSGAPR